jgi:hypothetical protein
MISEDRSRVGREDGTRVAVGEGRSAMVCVGEGIGDNRAVTIATGDWSGVGS